MASRKVNHIKIEPKIVFELEEIIEFYLRIQMLPAKL